MSSGSDGSGRLLWQAARHGWAWTIVSLLTSVGGAAAMLALPAVFAAAVDAQVSGAGSGSEVVWLAAVLAVLVGGEVLGQIAGQLSAATATRWLRHRLLDHVLSLGLPGRDRFAPGEVVSRLMSSTSEASGAGQAAAGAAFSVVVSLGGVAGLALIDIWLALAFLLCVPVGLALMKAFMSSAAPLAIGYLAAYDQVCARLVEAMAGVRTIRACGTLDQEVARILTPAADLTRLGQATWLAQSRVGWRSALLALVIQLGVLAVAGHGVSAGRLTPGQFLAALGYVSMALIFLRQSGILMSVAQARAGAERLTEVLDCQPAAYGAAELPSGPGELVLRGVCVRAGGRLILDRLELTVPAGSSVALVGGSSAGKSILAAVAGRLIGPDEGTVSLDGVPLDTVGRAALRREISFAFERPALLGETVAEVITMGDRHLGRDRVEWAATIAQADGFIRRLPLGYDTPMDQAPMSGGEAQRLGLARAIAAGGRLLILDDATSNLDTVTETRVRDVLTRALAGRTRLVVAHRAATAARCDLVAWLDGGRIRAVATHAELTRDPGYRALFGAGAGSRPKEPEWPAAAVSA